MKSLFQKKGVRVAATVIAAAALVYGAVYVDVILRARSAYLEGEKYWTWYENPALKEAALKKDYDREKTALEKKRDAGKLTAPEFARELDIVTFNYEQRRKESSIKYAYIWYQTALELFSPPESRWVRLARRKMPQARELWKAELKKNNIPFEDYMLD